MNTYEQLFYNLIQYGVATEEELALVTKINGDNLKTLLDVLEVRTGYRDMEDYVEFEVIPFG